MWVFSSPDQLKNQLYYGDNLTVLREHIASECSPRLTYVGKVLATGKRAAGNRQPTTGNRQLATGNWQLATGNW